MPSLPFRPSVVCRSVLVALFALVLSGCCSSSVYKKNYACEASWEQSEAAAEAGWQNVRHGLSQPTEPTLHEGMTAEAVQNALGDPSVVAEKEDAGDVQAQRWTYTDRALLVHIEDGRVVGWESL